MTKNNAKAFKRSAKVCRFKCGDLVWLPVPTLNETKHGIVISSATSYQVMESQPNEPVIRLVHSVLFDTGISSFDDERLCESREEALRVNSFWNLDSFML